MKAFNAVVEMIAEYDLNPIIHTKIYFSTKSSIDAKMRISLHIKRYRHILCCWMKHEND